MRSKLFLCAKLQSNPTMDTKKVGRKLEQFATQPYRKIDIKKKRAKDGIKRVYMKI